MTRCNAISEEYFNWMYDRVCGDSYRAHISYRKLLKYLYDRDFVFINRMDENRAIDGVDLRYRHNEETARELADKPCSVLEMMVALSIRCENDIMADVERGDRTSKWFWSMIGNLRLHEMSDDHFNIRMVRHRIDILLRREYKPDGTGGLFTVKHCKYDLTNIEIWYQMNWYLNSFL